MRGGGDHPVPRFLLYGDRPEQGDPPFVHIETIAARSQALNWNIQPHRHDSLAHVLLIREKGGRFLLDDQWHDIDAGAVMWIPSTLVHGFQFVPQTAGLVLTVSDSLRFLARDDLGAADLGAALTAPLLVDLAANTDHFTMIDDGMRQIEQELAHPQVGQIYAIRNHLALIQLTLLRHVRLQDPGRRDESERREGVDRLCTSPDLALVDRLRRLIARHLSEQPTVGRYADQLGVTSARLNAACRRVTGCSTLHLLHAALLAEAKRGLLYSDRPISEIAYALGFDDPAYFSRFFACRTGRTPTAFRALHIVA